MCTIRRMKPCAGMLLLAVRLWGQTAPFDVIISGARVVDGSGSPWFLADIGIRGDSIAAVRTFARVLGVYVREKNVLTLEDAVRRMSAYPAQRLKIWDRGMLRPGMKADCIVFDPASVADRAGYDKPHQYSVGVRDVLVNGKFVLRQDKVTAERPGRVLLGPAAER
jgi:N-acyl-D-aspartate/D-glutamate deacylase